MFHYSLLGGVLIVCGLYMVLWGQKEEIKLLNTMADHDQRPAAAVEAASEGFCSNAP